LNAAIAPPANIFNIQYRIALDLLSVDFHTTGYGIALQELKPMPGNMTSRTTAGP
jgi:hypothetical protein